MTDQAELMPTLFIPHGGGPCFFMDWHMGPPDTWQKMEQWLRGVVATLPARPSAVLVISGHWEEPQVTVNAAPHPELYFDYYGFPPHTYELTYPAPGDPELARQVQSLLSQSGFPCGETLERGLDHGVFVPFKLMLPEAELPVVQLSLIAGLDPDAHLRMGQALAPLRSQGVLIVGSGMSFHNMGALQQGSGLADSERFDDWLTQACELPPTERRKALTEWAQAPSALEAHPREEHLLPLMVAAGAAMDEPGQHIYRDRVMNATVSAFQFG